MNVKTLMAKAIVNFQEVVDSIVPCPDFMTNPIFDADSYKPSHFLQLPPDTKLAVAYIEARGKEEDGYVIPFGSTYYIKRFLMGMRITMKHIRVAERIFKAHGIPFNKAGFERIVKVHGGRWPVRIMAMKEGVKVPRGIPLAIIMNTDPELPWVAGFLETGLLRAFWYGTTVATNSYECKLAIKAAMEASCDNMDGLPFKLHDFGSRGVSSQESAAIGGAAHLVNFAGTDTLVSLLLLNQYYNTKYESGMARVFGHSIPAAEHGTVTPWGRDRELEMYRHLLKQFGMPNAIFAVVVDSYDPYHAVEKLWGEELHQEVIDSGACVVIRPDSGDPIEVLPRLLNILADKFGYDVNSKGFKVLRHVRVIQGDGVDKYSLPGMLAAVMVAGFSIDNVAFGMGGGLLQHVTRDDKRFAMKTCLVVGEDNKPVRVSKDPITDPGKRSKMGIPVPIKNADGSFGWKDVTDEVNWEDFSKWGDFMTNEIAIDLRKMGIAEEFDHFAFYHNGDTTMLSMNTCSEIDLADIRRNTGEWSGAEINFQVEVDLHEAS